MKSVGFLSEVNRIFGIEHLRLQKIAIGLRKLGVFPDGRKPGTESHVTATQAAHLIRAMALNLNPSAENFHARLAEHAELIDEDGNSLIKELARLISNNGERLFIDGVTRISFSLDRNLVTIVFKNPEHQQLLNESSIRTLVLKENERVYGPGGAHQFERFAILKKSALMKLANILQETGCNNEEDADVILNHVNKI